MKIRSLLVFPVVIAAVSLAAACGGKKHNVASKPGVQIAYENLQPTIMKIMSAGIAAKGTATQGANIPTIPITGDVMGIGTVGGLVAQSTGQNENLNLWVELDGYSDTGNVIYQTDNTSNSTKLQFGLQIRNQPQDNTMVGTLTGSLSLDGDVTGTGVFNLATATDLNDDDLNPYVICTHVTGAVTAASDTVNVDFVLPTTGLSSSQQLVCNGL